MQSPTLSTARLTLRLPTTDDLGAYTAFNAVSDTTIGTYRGGKSAAETRAVLDGDIAHWDKGFGMWLLRDRKGVVVGGAGLVIPKGWENHELTWWLMPDQRRLGYATEASRAVISFGYDTLNWPQVETMMRDENAPARHLALRLGGKITRRQTFPDGVARDVYALPRQPAEAPA